MDPRGMPSKLASRKWILALLIFIIASLLVAGDHITDLIWRDVTVMIGGGYFASQAFIDRNAK